MSNADRYREAGVDIDKADRFIDRIRPLVRETFTSSVITDIGGFAGLVSLAADAYERPVLVSSTDGVGTKLKLAFMMNKHDTVGIDLVAMCVNDIVVCGARPLFFLDYLAMGALDEEVATAVVSGIAEGCRRAKTPLVGGETAEMPGFYGPGEYDLVGFVTGVVDNDKIIEGSEISVGNVLIGLASSGLHSNGYSLVRRIVLDELQIDLNSKCDFADHTWGEQLLAPTRIYAETVRVLVRDFNVKGMAHITGGGLLGNLPRIMPSGLKAVLDDGSWEVPPIFDFLQQHGRISDQEMLTTFNSGVGLVACVTAEDAEEVLNHLAALDEKAWIIGRVQARHEDEPAVEVV
jgi:phosphoribosylformylglycinamidine cyclo-ligase